jgi:hypothetical protein
MSFSALFSNKAHGKMILVLEVQSSIARSSLLWYRDGQPAYVLCVDERVIPFKPNVGTPYFIKMTLRALGETIDETMRRLHVIRHDGKHKDMPHRPEEVHYILSSPWIASQARTLSMTFEKNTTITREKINEILVSERKKLVPETEGPLETVEEKIFDVRLNGYSVSTWEGKQTKMLDVAYVVTVGGADTIRRFREIGERIVRQSKIRFHSSLLLQYASIMTAMPTLTTYTLVHIHGELTDVLSVKHGSCTFFGSYPMGISSIIRKIASATKTDIQTADSLLSLYLGNKLDEEHMKKISPIMEDMSSGWSGELRKLFKEASLVGPIDSETIITARAHEDFFVKSYRTIHPEGHVEAWSSSDIMPNVVFESAVHRLRGVSAYAIALREIEEGRL